MHALGIIFIAPPPNDIVPPDVDLSTDEGRMLATMSGVMALNDYAVAEAEAVLDGRVGESYDYYSLEDGRWVEQMGGYCFFTAQYPLRKFCPEMVILPENSEFFEPSDHKATKAQARRTKAKWRAHIRRWFKEFPDHLIVTFDYHY